MESIFNKFNLDLSWLKNNTLYLAKHGSRAYGTHIEGISDTDYKGFCTVPIEYLFGFMKNFEQAELNDPDTVIFELRKFFKLAADCNPNSLEILYVEPEDIVYISPLGEEVLANRDLFLSKKIKFTMVGYSVAQLKRIKLHRRYLLNPPASPPTRKELGLPEATLIPQDQLEAASAEIKKELNKFQFDFMQGIDESVKIGIQSIMAEMLAELKITADQQWEAASRKIGLSDSFIEVLKKEKTYTNKKREWDQFQNWKTTRNPARAALEEKFGYDTKHAYHLVRLLRMAKETLITGKLLVKRPDKDELLAIRNGLWSYDEIIEFSEKIEKEVDELYVTTNVLPNIPDKNKLDKLCIDLIEKSL